ncbi:MAG: hypothetical protein HYU48_00625 [Candidatus Levybacteria bacterium]|nr:hypothetical protein [Candidatus Levybacteria bacterium]
MDKRINSYIEARVLEVLQIPNFSELPQEQKSTIAEKLRDLFNTAILDALIDSLTPDQLDQIKDIPADSPQMEDKIEEFASQIPLFITKIEEVMNAKVLEVKNNPALLS